MYVDIYMLNNVCHGCLYTGRYAHIPWSGPVFVGCTCMHVYSYMYMYVMNVLTVTFSSLQHVYTCTCMYVYMYGYTYVCTYDFPFL